MGIRSPIFYVRTYHEFLRLQHLILEYDAEDCKIEFAKISASGRVYVAVTCYTETLDELLDQLPDILVTNESLLTSGETNMSYAKRPPEVIPEWRSLAEINTRNISQYLH
jgi:hypothetical protein